MYSFNIAPKKLFRNILKKLALRASHSKVIREIAHFVVPNKLKRLITRWLFDVTPRAEQGRSAAAALAKIEVLSLTRQTAKVLSEAARQDFVVVCNAYPGGARQYGGEFIRSRVEAYLRQGLEGLVLEVSPRNEGEKLDSTLSGTASVLRIPYAGLVDAIRYLSDGEVKLLVHSPSPDMQKILQDKISHDRLIYWFHGFEVRDYRRLYFNYTTEEMALIRDRLDQINKERMEAAQICFSNKTITKIFVSNYLKTIAERDAGVKALNAHVIPNFIDGEHFTWQRKSKDAARRFLLIRSFGNRNYAGDIAVEAIKILSSRRGFDNLHFTIRGFGRYFAPLARELEGLANVDMVEKYLTPDEIATLHGKHGVFLCPTRFDTQGVTMGEAMASGLVCITNRVTAIPEYIDDECGILVPGDDPAAYAEAIWRVYKNPQLVPRISEAAGRRVRAQCGFDQTIAREIKLIQGGRDAR